MEIDYRFGFATAVIFFSGWQEPHASGSQNTTPPARRRQAQNHAV
jgi:hypothetical protein